MPNIEVTIKAFKIVALRLVVRDGDEDLGGRIDLVDLEDRSVAIFEGHYNYRANAVEQFEALDTEKKAIDWAYQNI